jgi:hypothetical protein
MIGSPEIGREEQRSGLESAGKEGYADLGVQGAWAKSREAEGHGGESSSVINELVHRDATGKSGVLEPWRLLSAGAADGHTQRNKC